MDAPTAPAAERPARSADGRVRTALVLLVLVLVLPLAWSLTGPPVVLGDPFLLVGAVAGGAAALAVAGGLGDPVRRSWRTSLVLAVAATVATLHVVVSVVRTWRAREGATVVPAPRTWVLVLTMTSAVALSVTAMLLSGAL